MDQVRVFINMTVELVYLFIYLFILGFSLLETVTVACYFILFVAINLLELVLLLCSCRLAQ